MDGSSPIRVSSDLRFRIDGALAPVATVAPGSTLVLDTEDAFAGQIEKPGDRRDRVAMPDSNPAVGPIAVEGARRGQTLVVDVLSIEPRKGQCCTYVWPYPWTVAALGEDVEHQTRICPIENGVIHWSSRLTLPYRPMIGVLGVGAPDATPTTDDAGEFGGNLDLREIRPGARVHLPVLMDGALLFVGDCHASQGQGELSTAALEMAATVTLRVGLSPDPVESVRVESAEALGAVAVAERLEDAVETAYARLARWLEADFEWNLWEAHSLLTQVGDVSLGFYRGGIALAKVSREIAES